MLGRSFTRMAAFSLGACAVLLTAGCGQSHAPSSRAAGSTAVQAGHSPGPSATATPGGQRAAATPSPAAGSQPAQAATYLAAIQVDAQRIIAASAARSSSCATRDAAGCRTAFDRVAAAAATFQRDLDRHAAPTCLKQVDSTIRSALDLYRQGARLGLQGLAAANGGLVVQGGGLLDQGTSSLTAASGQIGLATCSGNVPGTAP